MPFIQHFFTGEDGAEQLSPLNWPILTFEMSSCVRLCVCADNYSLNNFIKCLLCLPLSLAGPRLPGGSLSGDVVFHAYQFPAHKLVRTSAEPARNWNFQLNLTLRDWNKKTA